jgi:hypothetical protein
MRKYSNQAKCNISFNSFVEIGPVEIRALNPRFYFVHAGANPRFLTKRGIKNRDSVLWLKSCVGFVVEILMNS